MSTATEAPVRDRVALTARRTQSASYFYGYFVSFMKVLLPTVATALLLIVIIWPQLNEQNKAFEIGFKEIDKSAAENLRMEKARYTGVDQSKRPYSVTAEEAEQVDPQSPVIELMQPKADIVLQDGSWIAVTAEVGSFNRETQFLELSGMVNMFHDKGYEFRTTSAVLDLRTGDAIGTEPIHGQGPFGQVQSESFIVRNRGERVEFHGKAQVIILNDPVDPRERGKKH
jgi:lipopolysaccharide export system protein LptC